MFQFIKFFQGYLYVYLSGYSPERFLNLCGRKNIVLWDLQREQDGYRFFISRKAFALIGPLLDRTGTQVHVIRQNGVPYLMKKYKKHASFFIGIFCACFLLFFMSRFIWKVEIEGNSYYSTQTILDYLRENGIGYATLKSGINCKELQNMLRKEFTDMTWVSAKTEGTVLYLVIQERMKGNGAETDPDADTATSLIAKNSGTIASITVRRGTPLVSAGDTVEAGDILVSGVREILNDAGEVSARNYVSSDADVQIHTTLSYSDEFSEKYETYILTEKKKIRFAVCLDAWRAVPFFEPKEGNYIKMENICSARIGTDFYLPFVIIKTEYLEYEIQTGTYTKEEAEALAQEHLNLYCENLAENGVQILSNSVIIEHSGENILVHGDLEALVSQDSYEEILQREMEEGTDPDGIDTADDGHSD
ncbi:MAG: sporulation protein YqfD [Clostridiales bacterium]|nr:sporulation protein YqfD [Clostridiales bacterium]